jgi:hypothetical protein
MNTAKNIMSVPWGDRVHLLPKAMIYAFSLDVRLGSNGPYLKPLPPPAVGASSPPPAELRHLFDQSIITMPEGLRCEVPTGVVERADGEIGDCKDPSSCWLALRICTKLREPDATLHFETTGVINFDGGLSAFRAKVPAGADERKAQRLAGSVFLASCQTASTRTYRWLERRQVFGVGSVTGERPPLPGPTPPSPLGNAEVVPDWRLRLSIDLYAAG